MISYVRGTVLEVSNESVCVDVSGIGYELQCSLGTLANCIPGKHISLWAYTHVREDAILLYGFLSREERQLYLSLLKVNGVGPKMAIKILSGGPFERIAEIIEAGDAATLSKLPKVGKKTAEQIVLTLKGKLVLTSGDRPQGVRGEIVTGLANLGFKMADVDKVVQEMPQDIALEDGIRRGLAALTSL